ncbi:class I SAM-dependent methyltransferase [Candidatus Omnitrophota bacterium]
MENEIFHKMFEVDRSHWWFNGQRSWLKRFYSKFRGQKKKWLDVGCGVGDILMALKDDFVVFGIDANNLALLYSKKRDIPNLIKGDALSLPFKDESFDFVSLLGVMYHRNVKDDRFCLRECVRVCKKNGILFFSEPVVSLKGSHDIKEHTARRYSLKILKQLILDEGLKIERISYFNFFGFLPMFLIRKLQRFKKNKEEHDLEKPHRLINLLMSFLITLESIYVRYLPLPLGTTVICVAKRAVSR